MQLQGGGVVAVVRMMLLVFLQRLEFLGEVANLGLVSSSFGSLDLRLILLDVLFDGLHEYRPWPRLTLRRFIGFGVVESHPMTIRQRWSEAEVAVATAAGPVR